MPPLYAPSGHSLTSSSAVASQLEGIEPYASEITHTSVEENQSFLVALRLYFGLPL